MGKCSGKSRKYTMKHIQCNESVLIHSHGLLKHVEFNVFQKWSGHLGGVAAHNQNGLLYFQMPVTTQFRPNFQNSPK